MPYSYASYTGNGSTTQFTIPFAYLAQAHVHVYVAGVEKTLGVDFTINTGTAKVVFGSAPANAAVVLVKRITPTGTSERTVDFASGAGIQESDLDNSALQALYIEQETKDDLDLAKARSLRVPDSEASVTSLPDAVSRAGKLLGFDNDGVPDLSNTRTNIIAEAVALAAAGVDPSVISNGMVNARDFGAVADGTTDDAAALNAAATYANSVKRKLYIPGGTYKINSTLVIPSGLEVTGAGMSPENPSGCPTLLKAGTVGMLMLTYGSQGRICNIGLNGDYKAKWGAMSRTSSSHAHMECVEVAYMTEYGFVLNALQNGSFTQCTARYCKYGWVLANGARNNNFYACAGDANSTYYLGTYSATRLILFLVDLTNPNGFGLSTSVVYDGNSCNNWFGGIFERCRITIDVINNSSGSYTSVIGKRNVFYGVNLVGDAAILDSTNGYVQLIFNDCEFGVTNNSTPMGIGTAGVVTFQGECNFNGGASLVNRGWTQANNFYLQFRTRSSDLSVAPTIGGSSLYLYGGGYTVPITFSAATKTFSVNKAASGPQDYHGLSVCFGGPGRSSDTGAAGVTARALRPVYRITFTLSNIVGGSTQVRLFEDGASSPFQIYKSLYSAGTHQVLFRAATNSGASITFGLNDVTSYDVSNITIEMI